MPGNNFILLQVIESLYDSLTWVKLPKANVIFGYF